MGLVFEGIWYTFSVTVWVWQIRSQITAVTFLVRNQISKEHDDLVNKVGILSRFGLVFFHSATVYEAPVLC